MTRMQILRKVLVFGGMAIMMTAGGRARATGEVEAQARATPLAVFGVAAQSCATWLQHPQETDFAHNVMVAWVDGYLSANNEKRWEAGLPALVGAGTQGRSRFIWISQYCSAHPLNSLYHATVALVRELEKTGR
jgi:hypothetical protein